MALTVLVAPSGFKECISAGVAAAAITAGVRRALPDACIAAVPMVDGGEGFTEALVEATGGVRRLCRVSDPLGRPVLGFTTFTSAPCGGGRSENTVFPFSSLYW